MEELLTGTTATNYSTTSAKTGVPSRSTQTKQESEASVKTLFDERYLDNFCDDVFYVDDDDRLIMILNGTGAHIVYFASDGQRSIDDWIRRGLVRHEDTV